MVRWIDKRQVLMIPANTPLTSQYKDKMVKSGKVNPKTKESVIKTECIHDYNCNMGGVDRSDTMIVNVDSVR